MLYTRTLNTDQKTATVVLQKLDMQNIGLPPVHRKFPPTT